MPAGLRRFGPHGLLLLMIVIWGGSFAITKDLLGAVEPLGLIVARFWFASLCLAPFLLRRAGARAELAACARVGLLTGGVLATGYLLQTVGIRETRAATGGLIAGLIPLLVAGGGWLFLGARPGGRGLLGLGCGFTGMALLLWPASGAAGDGTADSLRGVLLQIGAVIAYAVHVLLLSRFAAGTAILAFSFWQLVVVALASSVVAGWSGAALALGVFVELPRAMQLCYLAVLATAIAIGVQGRVQPRIPPTHVALLFATQPLFAALAGRLFLDERLRAMQWVGGGVIIIGIVVAAFDRPAVRSADR